MMTVDAGVRSTIHVIRCRPLRSDESLNYVHVRLPLLWPVSTSPTQRLGAPTPALGTRRHDIRQLAARAGSNLQATQGVIG